MTIDRRQLFTLAWKRAKAQAEWFPTIRAAFAASLRAVWALAKANAEAETMVKRLVVNPAGWAAENVYRARAVANRKARLGSFYVHAW
jgi:hypothetical protein